jgi:hypothetical protein
MRLGLVVSVRVPGKPVRNLAAVAARVVRHGRRRTIELALANRGDVIEQVNSRLLRVLLVRNGRVVGRLRPARRELLPRSTGLLAFAPPPKVHGRVIVRIELRGAVRRFRLRL